MKNISKYSVVALVITSVFNLVFYESGEAFKPNSAKTYDGFNAGLFSDSTLILRR